MPSSCSSSSAMRCRKTFRPIRPRHSQRTDMRSDVVILSLVVLLGIASSLRADDTPDPLAWPPITRECKPWSRWWWLGSAVDKENLTRLLEQYRDAGIGGVEICPIY